MEDIKELERIVGEVNDSIDDLRAKKIEVKQSDLPSNLKIMLSGVSDSRAIDFLFSNNIDKLLEKLFELFMSGDITKILNNEEKMKEIFKELGFGEGSFEGPVSKTVIGTIQDSVNSPKYIKMKNYMFKALYVVRNLEKQSKRFVNPEKRKKYDEAVRAIKQILRFAAKIYRNRKIVTDRVVKGLENVVKEDFSLEEKLEAIE
jgi:hypothetical protein